MTENKTEIPIEISIDDIGIDLLESITKGTYEDPVFVIREYVQNGFDAEASEIRITNTRDTKDRLIIWDNGSGMDNAEVIDLKKIGVGRKSADKVGFRGIGVWSGLAISKFMTIKTKKRDDNKEYHFEINSDGIKTEFHTGKTIKEVLEKNLKLYEIQSTKRESGTEIELQLTEESLSKINDKEKIKGVLDITLPVDFHKEFPFREKISKYLEENVDSYRTCKIKFNGEDCLRPLEKDLDDPLFYPLVDNKETFYGYMWICLHRSDSTIKNELSRGILFKLKNFSIGKRENWITLWPPQRKLMYGWVTGEVHITHDNIWPDISRTQFEFSPERERLFELVRNELIKINASLGNRTVEKHAKQEVRKSIERLDDITTKLPSLRSFEKYQKYAELEDIKTILKKRPVKDSTLKLKRDQALRTIPKLQDDLVKEREEAENIIRDVIRTKKKITKKPEDYSPNKLIEKILASPSLKQESRDVLKNVFKILEEEISEEMLTKILKKIENKIT